MRFKWALKVKIKKAVIEIDFLIIPVLLLVIWKRIYVPYLITLVFITAHELGHICAACKHDAGFCSFRIMPVGVNAVIDDKQCSASQKIRIYLAGPIVNMIFALAIITINNWWPSVNCFVPNMWKLVFSINLWLAVFNLLPFPPLDGGRTVMELLSRRIGLLRAGKQLYIFSVLFSLTIIIVGVIILIKNIYNASLIFVGVYIFLYIKESKKETAILNMKNFVFKKSRIIRNGIFPVREIVVMENVKLLDVVKSMDYADVFHLINVLDDSMRLKWVLTEQEILDALMENRYDTTISELLTKR
jgi:stage IV sporulation protein FB